MQGTHIDHRLIAQLESIGVNLDKLNRSMSGLIDALAQVKLSGVLENQSLEQEAILWIMEEFNMMRWNGKTWECLYCEKEHPGGSITHKENCLYERAWEWANSREKEDGDIEEG